MLPPQRLCKGQTEAGKQADRQRGVPESAPSWPAGSETDGERCSRTANSWRQLALRLRLRLRLGGRDLPGFFFLSFCWRELLLEYVLFIFFALLADMRR